MASHDETPPPIASVTPSAPPAADEPAPSTRAPVELEGAAPEAAEQPGGARTAVTDGRTGCLLALALGTVLGLGSMGLAYAQFRWRSANVLEATGELAGLLTAAEAAPGGAEVRALGCDAGGAIGAEALERLARDLEAQRAQKEKRAPRTIDVAAESLVVYCATRSGTAPPCPEIARTYVAAARPTGAFVVTARTALGERCAEGFSADGASTGPAKSPNLPGLLDPGK